MQIKNILTLILAALSATGTARAQKKSAQKETQIITFDTKNYSSREREDEEPGKNSLSIGLLSWLNGYVPVYYERAITRFLSVQVGGGVTMRSYGNDFGQIVHADGGESEYFSYKFNHSDIPDKYESYKYRKSQLGYYLSVSPRIYFNDNIMDGFFLAPTLEYKKFNYTTKMADESATTYDTYNEEVVPRTGVDFSETMKCLDFTLNWGGHFQSENHLVFAWNLGFGVRNLSATRLDLGTVIDDIGNKTLANVTRDYSKVRPLFTFDLRIGGWF